MIGLSPDNFHFIQVIPMGIRFLCNHCEKRLNVKAAQAGQDGRCPHCLGRIIVPVKSTIHSNLKKQYNVRPSQPRTNAAEDSSIGLHAVDEQVTMDRIPVEGQPEESPPPENSLNFGPPDFNPENEEHVTAAFMLGKPKLPASIGKVDPIAEAPTRIWYFRSRELGEKGPFKGKGMQEQFDCGNVKVGCIVWREDWNDWLPAEKVFPSLVAEAKTRRRKVRLSRAIKESNYQMPAELDPNFELNQRKRRKNQIFIGAIAIGVVLIVVLLVVLLKLVSNNP